MKQTKRLWALLLAMIMVVTSGVGTIFAAQEAQVFDSDSGHALRRSRQNVNSYNWDAVERELVIYSDAGMAASKKAVPAASVQVVILEDGVTTVPESQFKGYHELAEVVIPESVQSIGNGAFAECKALYDIAIPEKGLKSIGSKAFFGCEKLWEITIPATTKSIGKNAFEGCIYLQRITVLAEVPPTISGMQLGLPKELEDGLGVIYVPEQKSVAYKAALGWKPYAKSIKELGGYTYDEATDKLTIFTVDGMKNSKAGNYGRDVKTVEIQAGAKGIPTGRFYSHSGNSYKNLTKVIIAEGVISIGSSAFWNCTALEEVSIPASAEGLGGRAFQDCTSLKKVTIAKGIAGLGSSTFQGCTALESIEIPEGVRFIGASLFEGCTALKQVTIPASVTRVYTRAFVGCTALESVNVLPGVPPTETTVDTFDKCTSLKTIYVPKGTGAAYKAAAGWKEYADKIVETNDLPQPSKPPRPPRPGGGGSSGGGSGSSGGGSGSSGGGSGSSGGAEMVPSIVTLEGGRGLAAGIAGAKTSATFNNYSKLLMEGIQAINEEIAKTGKKGLTVNFDNVQDDKVVSRLKVDPVTLGAVMKGDVPLGVHLDQNSAKVLAVRERLAKYFKNKMVVITFEQQKPLGVAVTVMARLDLTTLGKPLYFYSYDPTTNKYTRIASPNYTVDANGFARITAPFGGSIIITDAPLG